MKNIINISLFILCVSPGFFGLLVLPMTARSFMNVKSENAEKGIIKGVRISKQNSEANIKLENSEMIYLIRGKRHENVLIFSCLEPRDVISIKSLRPFFGKAYIWNLYSECADSSNSNFQKGIFEDRIAYGIVFLLCIIVQILFFLYISVFKQPYFKC